MKQLPVLHLISVGTLTSSEWLAWLARNESFTYLLCFADGKLNIVIIQVTKAGLTRVQGHVSVKTDVRAPPHRQLTSFQRLCCPAALSPTAIRKHHTSGQTFKVG